MTVVVSISIGIIAGLYAGWVFFGCNHPEQPEVAALSKRVRRVTETLKQVTKKEN